MCGPVGMRTSSSARAETQPLGFKIVNATAGSEISASAAGAVPKTSEIDRGSANGMGSTENLHPDKKERGSPWRFVAGGNLNSTLEGQQQPAGACPACESMFGKLDGKKQDVKLQLRGEPKSGTSFMYEWALNALMVTCARLDMLYGRDTCHVTWRRTPSWNTKFKPVMTGTKSTEMKEVLLLFDPQPKGKRGLNVAAGPYDGCSCENVQRVSISISSLYKHDLPVSKKCPWQHVDDITPEGEGCTTVAGRLVQNHTDSAQCLHEHPCKITDRRLQMLILRDPRAVVVSSFFYLKTHESSAGRSRQPESVGEYAVRLLPTICRFVHLRWLLLQERMADRTVEFTYDESLADPLSWHERWLSSVGLTPPKSVVQEATDTALRGEFGFAGKGVDKHVGGKEATPARTWEDEVSAEVAEQLNDICRVWLPPVLLEKFGIDAPL
eukprot:g5655.t1